LAAGLAVSFFGAALFAGIFLAADLAFDAAVVPVTAFLAGARLLAVVVFFAGAALALALLARTFLGAAFLIAGALALVELTAFFAVVDLVALLGAGVAFVVFVLVAIALGLEEGLEAGLFSLDDVSAGLTLGANLTLPEGPLGRTKTPLSAPVLMALASWVD